MRELKLKRGSVALALALALALTLALALALALTLTLTLTLTRYTPEQLAARNKKRTLESDVFHRKPARCRGDVGEM